VAILRCPPLGCRVQRLALTAPGSWTLSSKWGLPQLVVVGPAVAASLAVAPAVAHHSAQSASFRISCLPCHQLRLPPVRVSSYFLFHLFILFVQRNIVIRLPWMTPPSLALFLVSTLFTLLFPWNSLTLFKAPARPASAEFPDPPVLRPSRSTSPASPPVSQAKFNKRLLAEAEEIEAEEHAIAMAKIDSMLEFRKTLYRKF